MSAGTDGIDGTSKSAGAIADGSTVERATSLGLNTGKVLATFDSGTLFDKLGDSIVTGPTGNNVRDIRVLFGY
jgi:glycerate 2-kinase